MTLPRFLADEDLRHGIVLAVRRLEPLVQVITVRDASLRAASDGEVLAFAANEGWRVLSHDVNTMRAVAVRRVAEGLPMPGLFLIPQRNLDRPGGCQRNRFRLGNHPLPSRRHDNVLRLTWNWQLPCLAEGVE